MKDGKHVILYVEDDPDFVASMQVILDANDYIMVHAPTAEEGVKVYKRECPDLVIVDLMMEEVDAGMQFVKEMQALGNKAPIYMLSSVGDAMAAQTSYNNMGLDGVFQKPVSSIELLTILKAKLQ